MYIHRHIHAIIFRTLHTQNLRYSFQATADTAKNDKFYL